MSRPTFQNANVLNVAMSLKELEKEVQIDHLQTITYHWCNDCENQSSGS